MIGPTAWLLSAWIAAIPFSPIDTQSPHDRVLIRIEPPDVALPFGQAAGERSGDGFYIVERSDLDKINAYSTSHRIVDADLEQKIRRQHASLARRLDSPGDAWLDDPQNWFSDFRKLDEIHDAMQQGALVRPELHVEQLGKSIEDRDIFALTIDGAGPPQSERILIIGTQHAREWLSPMSVMYVARQWIDRIDALEAEERPTITFVPVINPDGYAFTWDDDRMWRKNRRPFADDTSILGVDLNRNWGHTWGNEVGASGDPDSQTYFGTAPFSEPETAAIHDFVLAKGDIAAFLDVHTFGQWIIYPASCVDPVSWGLDEFRALAEHMSHRVALATSAKYTAIEGIDFSYPACGDAADWFTEEQNAYGLTYEMRPIEGGFIVDPSEIIPTGEDLWAGVLDLDDWVQFHELEILPDLPKDTGDDTSTESDETGADSGSQGDTDSTSGDTTQSDDTGSSTDSVDPGLDTDDNDIGCRATIATPPGPRAIALLFLGVLGLQSIRRTRNR